MALCPRCHAQTEAPYARGRLIITPLGDGRFTVKITRRADKWAIRAWRHGLNFAISPGAGPGSISLRKSAYRPPLALGCGPPLSRGMANRRMKEQFRGRA